jgi:hypothetical protein
MEKNYCMFPKPGIHSGLNFKFVGVW